jgi:uncharacterized protein with LGFP repeats
MHPIRNNIGAYCSTANKSHSPAANSAGTRNGTGYAIGATRSLVLTANLGATSGTPDSFSVVYKLQDSLDGSTYADAVDSDSNNATLTVAAASSAAELDVDLAKFCRAAATHYRFLETVAFVGGTSPTVISGATITKGPGLSLPL